MNRLRSAALGFVLTLSAGAVAVAQVSPPADPGPPLSGYPRKALGLPTPAELKTATYVRDVIYGHRDGMALTYDVFKPVKNATARLWSTWCRPAGDRRGPRRKTATRPLRIAAFHCQIASRVSPLSCRGSSLTSGCLRYGRRQSFAHSGGFRQASILVPGFFFLLVGVRGVPRQGCLCLPTFRQAITTPLTVAIPG